MHIPKIFEQKNIDELTKLIVACPFATLVTTGPDGICADHIPLYIEELTNKKIVLKGHLGKGNPLWKEVPKDSEALAIFHGPDSYISPNYYPSKKTDAKVVPTWNYVAVHVKGSISFTHSREWKLDMLNVLTNQHEKDQNEPWSVSDAPSDFTEKMVGGIVGIEVEVKSIRGQWKVSQNKQEKDSKGVINGLSDAEQVEMAQLVEKHKRS